MGGTRGNPVLAHWADAWAMGGSERLVFREFAQDFDTSIKCFVARGKRDAEVGVSLGEDVAWDDEQFIRDAFLDEFTADSARRFGEDIERAARGGEFIIILESRYDPIALWSHSFGSVVSCRDRRQPGRPIETALERRQRNTAGSLASFG